MKTQPTGFTSQRERWRFDDDMFWESSYLFHQDTVEQGIVVGRDNLVYAPTEHGRVFCLDARTGAHRWTFLTDEYQSANYNRVNTPAIVKYHPPTFPPPGGMLGGGHQELAMLVFACGRTPYCLTDMDKVPPLGPRLYWKLQFPSDYYFEGSPVVRSDGRMYVGLTWTGGSAINYVVAVGPRGEEVWRVELDAREFEGATYYDGLQHQNPVMVESGGTTTIYVGTRGEPPTSLPPPHGRVYAIWGFDDDD